MANCDDILSKDVIIEMLSRLPVKSLIRLKCVCKYWHIVIGSPSFIAKHHYHHRNECCLLIQHQNDNSSKRSFALCHDETLFSEPPVYQSLDYLELPSEPGVISPFNGILGVWFWDRVALWNPATREFRRLSIPPSNLPSYFNSFRYYFGFGLDSTTNNLKLVWLRYFWDEKNDNPYHPIVVAVYTLRTASWRVFEFDLSPSTYIRDPLCNTYVNGVYYWLMSDPVDHYLILTFDMSAEAFEELAAPPDISKSLWGDLGLYNDSIALFLHDPHAVEKHFDIWVMKGEGWNKQLSVGPLPNIEGPIGFWKTGDLILRASTSNLVLYNPITHETKSLRHQGKVFIYKESLVSIKGENECWKGEPLFDVNQVHEFFTDFPPPIVGRITDG